MTNVVNVKNNKKEDIAIVVYLLLFFIGILGIHVLFGPIVIGEWDDYTLPIASIIYGKHISIFPQDLENYRMLFPSWNSYVDGYSISAHFTKAGGQMTYYFPTYAFICIPAVLLLKLASLDTTYAFMITNSLVLVITLFVVSRLLKDLSFSKRFLLILALSINPIIFYIAWPSAEVFMYCMVLLGLIFWYKNCKKRAAIFISIAGTLNPTILAIGIVMILEWFIKLLLNRDKNDSFGTFFKKNIVDALEYACCYVIGIIPMIYNFYNTGMINLTAPSSSIVSIQTMLSYMWAYLTDLNFGYLAYFTILFILFVIYIVIALIKKNFKYLVWVVAFIATIFCYSLMFHINCGMSGICRYDAWCSSFLVLGVILFMDDLVDMNKVKVVLKSLVLVGVVMTGIIICMLYPVAATNVSYREHTPLARYVLDNYPSLYNPLGSTFNSRTNDIDGGYDYKTPVAYTSTDGYITKILASEKDKETLLSKYMSYAGDDTWLEEAVETLGENETYINIPQSVKLGLKPNTYKLGEHVHFGHDDYDADTWFTNLKDNDYMEEIDGTWTRSKQVVMHLKTSSNEDTLKAKIISDAYKEQSVTITVNGEEVYSNEAFAGGNINFEFDNPGKDEPIEIIISLPKASSKLSHLESYDIRQLGLFLTDMVIEE